jgi:hypothetical protein
MLLNYQLRPSKGCGSIQDVICDIDKAIGNYTTDLYNNKTYMAKLDVNKRAIKDLLYYKQILLTLSLNSSFYPNYPYQIVISKVKTLI